MSNSRIPSPARSLAASTPRRYKPRGTRSVGSPARSNASTRLSAIVQKENMNSFVLTPLGRRSVLNDDTDIELVPGRKSWWKRLDENSRVMEVLRDENNQVVNFNNGVEDYMDVEVLSQEKKNYTMDFPDSSDCESIASIVLPQRKLFTQKDVHTQNKFGQIIENRETLTKLNKTNMAEKSLKITKKNLFNQNKQRTRPAFPAELLQMSPNKTAANKTKEMPALEVKNQARNLFGNNAAKRKNMFADFIASESDDEIPEIQPKVFGFNKKPEPVRRGSSNSRGVRDSPTNMSLLPEMDDWKMLPSSTMVEHQLEEAIITPVKRPRLSRPRQSDVPILEVPEPNEHDDTPITTLVERSLAEKSILTRSGSKRKSLQTQPDDNHQKSREKSFKTQQNIEENQDEPMQIDQDIINLSRRSTRQNTSVTKPLQKSPSKVTSPKLVDNLAAEQIFETSTIDKKGGNSKADVDQKLTTKNNEQEEEDNFVLELEEDDGKSYHEVHENHNADDNNASANNIADEIEVKDHSGENEDQNNESEEENNELVSENYEDQNNEIEVENDDHDSENEGENEDQNNESEVESDDHDSENEGENEVQNNESDVKNDDHVSENEELEEDGILKNESEVENDEHVSENDEEQVLSKENADEIKEQSNESEEENDNHVSENDEHVFENEQEQAKSDKDQDDDIDAEQQEYNAQIEEEGELEEQENDMEAEEIENIEPNSENHSDEVQSDIEIDEQNIDQAIHDDDNIEETNEQEDELLQNESDEEINQSIEDQQELSEELQESREQNESLLHDNSDVEEHNLENSHQESDDDQNEDDDDPDENEAPQDDNEEISASQEIELAANIQESIDKTHDTTGRHRDRNKKVTSPEAILHNATNEMESFSNRGRNTSIRKTKSMIVHTNRPSLAPHRDSTGISDGTKNSSAEGSGWDSHRVTRKTIRQTFGKDFTPRKSLRAMVMEKSAKRQTAISDMHTETIKHPQANSTEFPDDSGRVYEDAQESVHEISLRTRQSTLEMYLQKVKKQNMENKMKIDEAVRNSIKARPNDHQFKVPSIPRRPNAKLNHNTKAKAVKPLLPVEDLPTHIKEDLQYKPPKRFRPNNAGWITKRLYKFLETKLEPTYDYKARVRAEKLVVMIYEFTKQLRKNCMTKEAIQQLKHEMARLQIVRTHFEFYEFFNEFMPREVRVKVIPDIVNGVPVPRQDVFSDILR